MDTRQAREELKKGKPQARYVPHFRNQKFLKNKRKEMEKMMIEEMKKKGKTETEIENAIRAFRTPGGMKISQKIVAEKLQETTKKPETTEPKH